MATEGLKMWCWGHGRHDKKRITMINNWEDQSVPY